jgi:hypothetical protein
MAQLREKVTFDPNVPVPVTLEFDRGKEVNSARGGSQFQYFLADEKIMYVDPEVAEKIAASGAKAGDTLEICRRTRRIGQQTRTEWEVVHLLDEPDYAHHEKAATQAPTRQAPRSAPAPAAQPAKAAPPPTPASRTTPRTAQAMAAAFYAAIEAAEEAESYAAQRGRKLQLDTDAIKSLAVTIFIQEAQR